MKNIFLCLALSTSVFFTSCTGDQGPPGLDGINILGQVFEAGVNFQYDSPSGVFFSSFISIPFEVYESDVVLAYRYEGQEIVNGEAVDIWNQLPRSVFYQDGTGDLFEYSFNHTYFDVQFIIDGNFNLSTLNDPDFLNNQTFRIAVIPAEYASSNLTMEELLQALEINPTEIETIQ